MYARERGHEMAAARTQPLAAASGEITIAEPLVRRSYAASIKKGATYYGAGQLSLPVDCPGLSPRPSLFLSLPLSLAPRGRQTAWRLSLSLSSLSRGFLSLSLPLFWWLRCRSNAAGVAAACERWPSGGAEGTEQTLLYGTGGARGGACAPVARQD